MKKIVDSFAQGYRQATTAYRMVLALYLLNVLIALPVALAFRGILESTIGNSLSLDRFIAGFDATVFSDFLHTGSKSLAALTSVTTWIALLYLFLSACIDGGILGHFFAKERPFSLGSFFGDCGTFFYRYAKLTVIFGAMLLVVFFISDAFFETIYEAIDRGAVSEVGVFYARILTFGGTVFLVSVVVLMSDYARIETARSGAHAMVSVSLRSAAFVMRKFPRVIGLQIAMFLASAVIIAGYLYVEDSIPASAGPGIIVLLCVQQATILLRTWVRIATFAAERHLYLALAVPPAASAPRIPPEPTIELPAETSPIPSIVTKTRSSNRKAGTGRDRRVSGASARRRTVTRRTRRG